MMFTMASRGYEPQSRYFLEAELRATLNLIPAHTWYADPSGALTFVNERLSNYLGLPNAHPLRFGTAAGAQWDSHIPLLHPDDHEETRRVWSTCLRTNSSGEVSFRVRNAEGRYRWFLSRAEPLRASDGTLLYWLGVDLDIARPQTSRVLPCRGTAACPHGQLGIQCCWIRLLVFRIVSDPRP
jgi:PAS domain-containing protein